MIRTIILFLFLIPITANADNANKINQAKTEITEFLDIQDSNRIKFHDDTIEITKNEVIITATYINGINQKCTASFRILIKQ